MAVYELYYIVGATNEDIMSYVGDFKLEMELQKFLDKFFIKVSRRIVDNAWFIGFDPNVELLLKYNGTSIFRGRCKTSDIKQFYEVEAYSCGEILSRTIAQKVYENTTPELIFTDLINTYTDLTAVTPSSSGVEIERFVANDYLNTIVSRLAEALDWEIHTDSSKNIYFQPRGTTTNATVIYRTTTTNNAIFDKWKEDHNEMCNYINLTGGEVSYSDTETFYNYTSGTHDIELRQIPDDVEILADGVKIPNYNITILKEIHKIRIIIDNNVSTLIINYNYTLPIYVERQDSTSINAYGTFKKTITNKWIVTRSDAINFATTYISTYKNPLLSNTLLIHIPYITVFNVGEQVRIDDDVDGYDQNFVINKITLELTKGYMEINVGSYISGFSNIQSMMRSRIQELEKDFSKNIIQLYSNNTDSITLTETLTETLDSSLLNVDLSDFVETDTGNFMSHLHQTITFTNLPDSSYNYYRLNRGSADINDFDIHFNFCITSDNNGTGIISLCALSDTTATNNGWTGANGVGASYVPGSNFIYLWMGQASFTLLDTSAVITLNTYYYCSLHREGTTITLDIYLDSIHSKLFDSITGTAFNNAFQYIWYLYSYNNGSGTMTGTLTNYKQFLAVNNRVSLTYPARCDWGRGTLYDARVGLCQV